MVWTWKRPQVLKSTLLDNQLLQNLESLRFLFAMYNAYFINDLNLSWRVCMSQGNCSCTKKKGRRMLEENVRGE